MKIMIIEDEPSNANHLKQLINATIPDADIIAQTASIKDSVKFLSSEGENKPDLIFSDIKLADGLCFSIFEDVNIDVPVIFTTAYDEYAMKAFDYNSLSYIIKPVQKKDIENIVGKISRIAKLVQPDLKAVAKSIGSKENNYLKRIILEHSDEESFLLQEADICVVESDFRCCKIYAKDGRWGIVPKSLKYFEDALDPDKFLRVSRKHIVALDKILTIRKASSNHYVLYMIVNTDSEITIAADKLNLLKR